MPEDAGGGAGGGTRTPDTRIMIPPGFPVFTGDSADFGRQIGLFCQALCTLRTDSVRVSGPVSGLDDGRLDRDPVLRAAGLELTVVRENRVDPAGIAQLDRGRQMDGIESADLGRLEARGVVQEPCRQRLEHDRGEQLFSLDLKPCAYPEPT